MSSGQTDLFFSDHNRRSEGRAATVFRPVLIETDDFAGFCLVRNLSPNGLMGDVYTEFASNCAITVQFACGKLVEGTLIWCREGRIGIQFAETIDVADILGSVEKKIGAQVHRAPRLAIQYNGHLLVGDRALPVEVQDISQRGIKAVAPFVRPGDEVWVCLNGMDQRRAVVRWTQCGTAGLNFMRPLAFEELAIWIVRLHSGKLGARHGSIAERRRQAQ